MDHSQIVESISVAVRQVVESGGYRLYSGESCERLTTELAQRMSANEVLLTSSGTIAMELALRALGVAAGDEVLLSAYDYPGNFWAIERIGARPVLLDIDPTSWRINASGLEHAWEQVMGCKAVVVSHLHGQLQDVAALRFWCDDRGLALVEDTCQGVGATIQGRPAGSFGHASIVSFGGGKVLSAGRGGALLTSDGALAQRAKILAGGGSGPFALSELQAAVVNAQLPYLDDIVSHSRQYFAAIAKCLQTSDRVLIPFAEDLCHTAFYQAGFILKGVEDPRQSADARDTQQTRIVDALRTVGIPAGTGFPGFHRRSARRCRQAHPLEQVANVAARTVTIHHSAATIQTPATRSPASAELAAEILASLDKK